MRIIPFGMDPFLAQYDAKYELYNKLGMNLHQVIESSLVEKEIPYLAIYHRVKEKKSFIEKIGRKDYSDPIAQTDDILGLRIICYYQSDVNKICNLIKEEFDVLEAQDKIGELKDDQFGYRSFHNVIKIKKEWTAVPNYRGLEDLKAEIQVRTILMHAWAEIEHKLAYKKEEHIDSKFRRNLSRISAKLEEADEQFESLKNDISNYVEKVTTEVNRRGSSVFLKMEMNKDNLQAFLDYYFPDREGSSDETINLLDELLFYNISFKDIVDAFNKCERFIAQVEAETNKTVYNYSETAKVWHQVGLFRIMLELGNEKFFEGRFIASDTGYNEVIQKWQVIISAKSDVVE